MDYLNRLEAKLDELGCGKYYRKACIDYARKLIDSNMPVIFDKTHLSLIMGININTLNYYIASTDEFYTDVKIPKHNGKYRNISMPSYNLKKIQRWILDFILYNIEVSECCTGFTKGRSIVDNAIKHTKKEIVINLDIENFFPSIEFESVFYMFYKLGYTKELSYTFSKLLTYKGILPQGSPASPCVANILMSSIDKQLQELSVGIESDYTRYADDITISGKENIIAHIPSIIKIIEKDGFKINEKKLKVQNRTSRQEVTGIVVNDKLSVKKEFKKRLRQHIYYCKKFGVYDHLKHIKEEERSFYKEYLYGHAYFIKMVEPECGEKFIEELDNINWNT